MRRPLMNGLRALAGILLFGGLFAGAATLVVIAGAAWSDFRSRGCLEIPRDGWPYTANCSDGWLGTVVFGGAALFLAGLTVFLWRRYA